MARTVIKLANKGASVRVQPGEYYVTNNPQLTITTVLGSCVAACIRNPITGFGGMNHFMLPESDEGHWGGVSSVMRYGNHAMETLINEVLKSGCPRSDIEIKLFGGGNMYAGVSQVGSHNALFAMEYLKNEGYRCVANDLGGNFGRRIEYNPSTGKVKRLLLTENQNQKITLSETKHRFAIDTKPIEGDIELFD
jgi:chemotaxis protein CheD